MSFICILKHIGQISIVDEKTKYMLLKIRKMTENPIIISFIFRAPSTSNSISYFTKKETLM